MTRCCSMLKPIDGICQHTNTPCLEFQDECINWADREYYDSTKTYPYGTLKCGYETKMWTNRGWMFIRDCKPNFKVFGVKQYAVKIIFVEEEECGPFESWDRKFSNIKRLVRNIEVKSLEGQWNI